MKLIELASPFGVFVIGVVFLALGYSLYLVGLSAGDIPLRDSALPIENLGLTLMVAGLILYAIASVARQAFK